jgi:hypothetical protein
MSNRGSDDEESDESSSSGTSLTESKQVKPLERVKPDTGKEEEASALRSLGRQKRHGLTGYEPRSIRPLQHAKFKDLFDGSPKSWPDYRGGFRLWLGTYYGVYYEMLEILDKDEARLLALYADDLEEEALQEFKHMLMNDRRDVTRVLVSSQSKGATSHIRGCKINDPFDMWQTLSRDYEGIGSTSVMSDIRDAQMYRMGPGTSLVQACGELEEIFRRLDSRGEPVSEVMKCGFLLASLSMEYREIKGAIYASNQELKWRGLVERLHAGRGVAGAQATSRMKEAYPAIISPHNHSSSPMRAFGRGQGRRGEQRSSNPAAATPRKCFNCGMTDHLQASCPKPRNVGSTQKYVKRTAKKPGKHGVTPQATPTTLAWVNVSEISCVGSNAQKPFTDVDALPNGSETSSSEGISQAVPDVSNNAFFFSDSGPVLNILDSGAAAHHLSRRNPDMTEQACEPVDVSTAGPEKVRLHSRGNVDIKVRSGTGEPVRVAVSNALVNPSLSVNLLSVSLLDRAGYTVMFGNGRCSVIKGDVSCNEEIVATGLLTSANVYVLDDPDLPKKEVRTDGHASHMGVSKMDKRVMRSKTNDSRSSCAFSYPANGKIDHLRGSLSDLHRRLGHISLSHLLDLNHAGIISIVGDAKSLECSACARGKIRRAPYRAAAHFSIAAKAGVGINVDCVGPFRTATLGAKRYALFISDSFSSYHVCYLLRHKNEQPSCLEHWIKWSLAQTNNKLRWMRADREWMSQTMDDMQRLYGLEVKLTTRNHPQSNGVAERAGGAILQMARTQLLLSGVGKILRRKLDVFGVREE